MQLANDTIAAIATARGRAALAVLRLSGPDAIRIADRCFRGKDLRAEPSHTAHVGYVTSDDGGDVDQVVVTLFRGPRSVTGEDVVEISCHGGDLAAQLILNRLQSCGARLAEPGEFTQRAFMNGKIDLAQAEAVADLIHASSTLAHRVSLAHLQGRYSEVLEELRRELLELCAFVELELDFAEEDVEFADRERLERLLEGSERLLVELLTSYRLGMRLRDGVRVVIGGRPNAGKSTLLNAILGRDRAIVSPIPGTTRDEIEAEAEIEGLLFRFVDTAGLRDAADEIEAEGVRRAERSIETGDVLLYVYDVSIGLDEGERRLLDRIEQADVPVILLGNKTDLVDALPSAALASGGESARDRQEARFTETSRPNPEGDDDARHNDGELTHRDRASAGEAAHRCRAPGGVIRISATRAFKESDELEPLLLRLVSITGADLRQADASTVVTNQRHRQHLQAALGAIRTARTALESAASGDTLSVDLRTALHEIGAITGEITTEDVLDQIFSRFCIGK